MAEDDGFGDAGGSGNFLGGSGETFAGEEVEGGFDELKAAVAGAKAWGGGGEGGFVWDWVKWFHFVWVGRKNGFVW